MNWRIMIITVGVGCIVVAGSAVCQDAAKSAPEATLTPQQSASYSLGVQLGKSLKGLGADVDREMVFRGIEDVLDSKPLLMSDDETRNQARTLYQEAQKRQMEQHRKQMEENMAAQKAFLEENKTKEGITTLEDGLQYKVIKPGKGKTPTATDRVKFQFTGRLLDGTVFDSSEKRGGAMESQVNKVVMPGMREALLLMKEGDKWELYVPSSLGYGAQPMPKVGPNQLLVVELELLEVLPPAAAPTPEPPKPPTPPQVKPQS
ncbi:MAG: FKBP-type peptidyl-prolyl cis-trans isomerase [Candidatus Hydrogenedentes bacterium]|nr:FKBP-type peptidyl-prolyl cis-trans isomerase [Candidatus Hydrogenedentota bacterium]